MAVGGGPGKGEPRGQKGQSGVSEDGSTRHNRCDLQQNNPSVLNIKSGVSAVYLRKIALGILRDGEGKRGM